MIEYFEERTYQITLCDPHGKLIVSQEVVPLTDREGRSLFAPSSTEWLERGKPTIRSFDYFPPEELSPRDAERSRATVVTPSGIITKVVVPVQGGTSARVGRRVRVYRVSRKAHAPKARRLRLPRGPFEFRRRSATVSTLVPYCQDLNGYAFRYADGHRWPGRGYTWRFNAGSFGPQASLFANSLARAYWNWSYTYTDCTNPDHSSTARVSFPRGANTTSSGLVQDGVNAVFATADLYATCDYPPEHIIACTQLWPFGNVDGTAWETDIAFPGNGTVVIPATGQRISWAEIMGCPNNSGYQCDDFQGVATHEIGHSINLAHVWTGYQTMWGGGECPDGTPGAYCHHYERTLGAGDINGLWILYGPW